MSYLWQLQHPALFALFFSLSTIACLLAIGALRVFVRMYCIRRCEEIIVSHRGQYEHLMRHKEEGQLVPRASTLSAEQEQSCWHQVYRILHWFLDGPSRRVWLSAGKPSLLNFMLSGYRKRWDCALVFTIKSASVKPPPRFKWFYAGVQLVVYDSVVFPDNVKIYRRQDSLYSRWIEQPENST